MVNKISSIFYLIFLYDGTKQTGIWFQYSNPDISQDSKNIYSKKITKHYGVFLHVPLNSMLHFLITFQIKYSIN